MSDYDPDGRRQNRWIERDSFERTEQQREFLLWQRRRERCMSVWRSVASGLITAAVLAALSYGGHIVSWLIQGGGLSVTPLP